MALGFSRFSYALLLPAMRATLEWSYAEAGSLNTANALGYLIGTLTTAWLVARVGIGQCFWVALLLTGAGLFATGLTGSFTALLTIRLLTGVTCAYTFISGATLASHLAKDGHGGLVLGLYFGGVGTGIFLAGLGLPQAMEYDAGLWPYPWLAMGILTFIAVYVARPVALKVPTGSLQATTATPWRFPVQLLPALTAYALFGLGYISYMTFIIAYLRSGAVSTCHSMPAKAAGIAWMSLGTTTGATAASTSRGSISIFASTSASWPNVGCWPGACSWRRPNRTARCRSTCSRPSAGKTRCADFAPIGSAGRTRCSFRASTGGRFGQRSRVRCLRTRARWRCVAAIST